MTTLEWSETEDGHVSSGYLITRMGPAQWVLHVDASLIPPGKRPRTKHERPFASLRSARAAALHLEVVRVRRIKLIRHTSLAIAMFAMSVAFYVTMMAGTAANRLELFTLAGVSLVVSLSEGLDAFVLLVADGWDHRYEVPRVTVIDRTVTSAVVSTLWPKVRQVSISEQMASVRPLT
jgi:hypothetical protein